ncbi:MAG: hypothetical protein AM326_00885 [Candidatus Thorarchaeota archaeon SMTZ-45]|nr:MAG: hypothetical protein AM326_00885 [Candidatus Thorarchaeota archaeon SMTZ-45]
MTRTSIVQLTSEWIDDWLKVYNKGKINLPEFKPLTSQQLNHLIKQGTANPERMLLGLEGGVPTAVARYIGSDEPQTVYLSDVSILPGKTNGLQGIAEYVMAWARDSGAERIAAWTPMSTIKIPDVLSEYTFEARRVLVSLKRKMNSELSIDETLIDRVKQWDSKAPGQRLLALFGGLFSRPLDLHELRDEMDHQWEPRFILHSKDLENTLAVAYRSEANRQLGWIDLTPLRTGPLTIEVPDSDLISHLSDRLYLDGVNEIRTEVDGDLLEKQPFLEAGFETIRTIIEMELQLSY